MITLTYMHLFPCSDHIIGLPHLMNHESSLSSNHQRPLELGIGMLPPSQPVLLSKGGDGGEDDSSPPPKHLSAAVLDSRLNQGSSSSPSSSSSGSGLVCSCHGATCSCVGRNLTHSVFDEDLEDEEYYDDGRLKYTNSGPDIFCNNHY